MQSGASAHSHASAAENRQCEECCAAPGQEMPAHSSPSETAPAPHLVRILHEKSAWVFVGTYRRRGKGPQAHAGADAPRRQRAGSDGCSAVTDCMASRTW
jgi:hypothetical protein